MTPRLGHGVVEGFYGRPWTHAERIRCVEALGRMGLQVFVVAPKNDPRGFAKQRRTSAELTAIGEVAAAARAAGVRLYVGASLDNVEGLVDAGVAGVVVSLDDTWTTFAPALATRSRGEAHGRIAAEALARARRRRPDADVLLVPAIYHHRAEELGRGALAYLRGIAGAAPGTPVAWTGPAIFSRSITPGDVARLRRATGLRLWLWNNAVTNDWLPLATGELVGARAHQKLSFGSIDNLSPGVEDEVDGILLNAAREPALTEVSARCLAAWLADPMHYDADRALSAALDEVGGAEAGLLAMAHDLTCRHPLSSPARFEARDLVDAVADLRAGRVGAEDVRARLDAIDAAAARASRSRNAAVLECAPTLERAAALARAARLGLERRAAASSARDKELAIAIEGELRHARRIRWQVGLGPLQALVSKPSRG